MVAMQIHLPPLLKTVLFLLLLISPLGLASGEAGQSAGKATVDGLLYDLKSPDAFRRRDAVQTLGERKTSAAVPDLVRLVDDPSIDVRRALVRTLGALDDLRCGPALANMLSDSDGDVRKAAVRAIVDIYLGKEGIGVTAVPKRTGSYFNPGLEEKADLVIEPSVHVDPKVISALGDRLRDEDRAIRQDAARALGILRGRAAVPAMIECLKAEKEKAVILALIESLYKIGDSSVGADLVPFIYHEDKTIHDQAILAVGILRSKEAAGDLTKLYESNVEERRTIFKIIPVSGSDDLQIRSLESLARIAAPESKTIFVAALTHADSRYRQAGAEGLARMGDKSEVTEVSRLRMRETKENARLALSFALFRMGRREYLDDLVHAAGEGSDQADSYLLELHKNEVSLLYPYLEDASPKARARVADALGLIGDEQALKHLDPLTQDTHSDVLSSAVRAIRRIQARTTPQKPTSNK